ncbi:MAG: Bax inhibitor-1 family protein [Planctomycetota bacterium]|nr:Bax inhibitor-1 family protein [Planctomycetota bacterium]
MSSYNDPRYDQNQYGQQPHGGAQYGGTQYEGSQAMAQSFAHPMFAADAAVSERVGFIRRTYLHLAGAILLFVALEAIVLNVVVPSVGAEAVMGWFSGYNMLILLFAFMGVSYMAQSWAHSGGNPGIQYLGLGLYVLFETIIFMPILVIASTFYPGAIETAAVASIATFGGLTAFVFITKSDFSFLRSLLVVGGLAAMAVIVVSIFTGGGLGPLFSGAMILLAIGYILYDTSNVLHRYRTDQHVAASLALFSSVAILFFYILRLVMASRD